MRAMPDVRTRPAVMQDADAAVHVLRASITRLCVQDHREDPETVARWLRNKTADNFRTWVADPEKYVAITELDGVLRAVGALRRSGDLDLCYVSPGWEHRGVGSDLLRALEAQAASWSLAEMRLISTATARRFYERRGWRFVREETVPGFGLLRDCLYVKPLSPDQGAPRSGR